MPFLAWAGCGGLCAASEFAVEAIGRLPRNPREGLAELLDLADVSFALVGVSRNGEDGGVGGGGIEDQGDGLAFCGVNEVAGVCDYSASRITLHQLSCNTETQDGGSNPYLWAVLLQVDDKTIASGALVARIAFAPSPTGAQIIIAEGMRAGGTAPVPAPQQRLAAQFDPGQERRDLILITVLWDQHGFPFDAILAGYDAFLGTSRDAFPGSGRRRRRPGGRSA
jgi:hypothetical protein